MACPQQPYPYAPLHVGEGYVFSLHPEAKEQVNEEEPHVAAEPVQYPAYEGTFARHAGQLPVGAIVPVRPNEKPHAYEVHPEVFAIEEPSTCRPNDDTHQCHRHGMHAKPLEQACPQVAGGACHVKFEWSFRVLAFQCRSDVVN